MWRRADFWLKAMLAALLIWLLFKQLFGREGASAAWNLLQSQSFQPAWIWLGIAFVLMPLNWSLEVLKWRVFLPLPARPPLSHSWKAILGGIAWSFLTPNRSGEYAGRVLAAGPQERWPSVHAALAGAYCQMLVLLGMGLPALMLFSTYRLDGPAVFSNHILIGGAILLIFLFAGGGMIQTLIRFVILRVRNGTWQKWLARIEPLQAFTRRQLGWGLSLAVLRYSVYTLQYYAMLRFCGIDLNLNAAFAGVGTIYLIQTGLPLPPALGFLARGEIALLIWQTWPVSSLQVLTATYGLFVINLALPALVGVLWMFRK